MRVCVVWKHAVSPLCSNSRVCRQHSSPRPPPVSLSVQTQRTSELMSQLAKLRLRGASSDGGHVQEDWAASMDNGQLKWFLVWQIESAGYEISKGRKHSQHIADQWKSWCHAVGQCIETFTHCYGQLSPVTEEARRRRREPHLCLGARTLVQ